ncbi:MAG: glycoside hydrolase family 65 protein [Bacteroidales bacterium]
MKNLKDMNKDQHKKILFILILIFAEIMVSAQDDGWCISADRTENYTGIAVGNGRIGIVSSPRPFESEMVILNNVYDNELPLGVSKILAGMNFLNLKIEIDGQEITPDRIQNWHQILFMKEAFLRTTFSFENKASFTCDLYALRNLPYAGYMDVTAKALKDVRIKVTGKIITPHDYRQPAATFETLRDLEVTMPFIQTVATSREGKHIVATSATFIWHSFDSTDELLRPQLIHDNAGENINMLSFQSDLKKGSLVSFAWAGAECTTKDFSDPVSESERQVINMLLTPRDVIIAGHRKLWEELWQGDIEIEGDLSSQQDVRLALYHLYSFGREGTRLSIPPMGLSSQNYNGHIFWDSELWMFPPMLLLNRGIAESMINYRIDRLAPAMFKASTYGYKGAMFPWESDDTGEEATPPFALTGTFEHHITSDIAIAAWNYYRVTGDRQWLESKGYELLKETAEFWISRVTQNSDGTYSIRNVVGANEFAHNVDDNAFTNGSAITCLRFAVNASAVLGKEASPEWKRVADNLVIYRFPDGTTMEHSRYEGERIKQADVNLLAYPLEIITDPEAILLDMKYYEPKLADEGPAMSKSVLALLYARLGDPETAYRLFRESYMPNKRPPFGALAETALSNNPYFVTGAGGMLQTVIFGFGGLHITENGIVQRKPVLPRKWKSLIIKGVGRNQETYVIKNH